jgi:hypothetical protein
MTPMGLGPENDCVGESTAIVNNKPILSSERMLHKDYGYKCSVGKKILVVSLKGLVARMN